MKFYLGMQEIWNCEATYFFKTSCCWVIPCMGLINFSMEMVIDWRNVKRPYSIFRHVRSLKNTQSLKIPHDFLLRVPSRVCRVQKRIPWWNNPFRISYYFLLLSFAWNLRFRSEFLSRPRPKNTPNQVKLANFLLCLKVRTWQPALFVEVSKLLVISHTYYS